VYRHFPDDETLFLACSAQWMSRQVLPDPDSWEGGGDPLETVRTGLADIYRYFREGEQMLTAVTRDADAVPVRLREARLDGERAWRESLLRQLPGRRRTIVRSAVAHATAFSTWRSLCVDLGLSDRSATELMVAMVAAACEAPARAR
jgi:AcrR family transcriptional regulator